MTDTTTKEAPAMNGASEFDFSHLQITDESVKRYDLGIVAPGCWIEGRPAMPDINNLYRDGILAIPDKVDRLRKEMKDGTDEAEEEQQRQEDIHLFAHTVLTGWGGVVRADNGEPVPFSPEAAERFLRALPTWMFERIRLHYKTPETFVGRSALPPPEPASDVAGN